MSKLIIKAERIQFIMFLIRLNSAWKI